MTQIEKDRLCLSDAEAWKKYGKNNP